MPNWVKNVVNIDGPNDDIDKALALMRDEDGKNINFNHIIPRPKRLNITSGGYDKQYVAAYLRDLSEFQKRYLTARLSERILDFYGDYYRKYMDSFTMNITDTDIENLRDILDRDYKDFMPCSVEDIGKIYIDNILDYGDDTWYEWSCRNWGTKWNACECKIGDDYLEFETAWSAPHPVITKLSQRFPGLTFDHEWADENIGHNCGKRTYKNGDMISDMVFESEGDARRFACDIWGYDPDEMEEED